MLKSIILKKNNVMTLCVFFIKSEYLEKITIIFEVILTID